MHYFNLKNGVVVAFDFESGETAKISYNEKGITVGRVPIFSVKMRDKLGKFRVVSSTDCAFLSCDGEIVKYTSMFFNVEIFIACRDGQLILRVNVINKTDDLLEWIELCPILVGKKLENEGGEGEIVYPYNEGCLVRDMAYRESMPFKYAEPDYPSKNNYSIFPSMIFAQFIAYGANGQGLYLGMHDQGRTTKHIDFCYYGEGIKVFTRAFCDVDYGENYQMPFDTVLVPYLDDWRSAVDIYYDWFSKNLPNGLVKISQNKNLPKWYAQSPLVITYPVRGKHDTCVEANGFYPYENVLPVLDEISHKTDSKIMALLMHWEGTAPWAPPYCWPPYGGEEVFSRFVQKAHDKDMLVGLYCSGMGWTQQSNIVKGYNQEQAYKDLKIEKIVCANTNGEIKSTICTAQRKGFDLCPATSGAKDLLIKEYNKICASNIDYLQALDQNHGGCSCFCYSDNHGHTPAPGRWQHEETNKMLESINKNGVLFGCESAASEPFLKELNFSDNRFELNYYLGEAVPIYSYIFHEYVNNFMGNQICSMLEKKDNCFTYRLAYSFLAGDMLTLVIGENGVVLHSWCDYTKPLGKNVESEPVFKLISNLNGWRKGAGKDFLHYGKMIKPIKISCPKESFKLEDEKTYLTVDSVISSAYSFNGERAQFLVNYNLYPVEVTLEKECDVYLDSKLNVCEKGVKSVAIAPLTAIMIKI